MRLTIDKLDGNGERDLSAMLDADAPPKIVRKLNQAPTMTVGLVCGMGTVSAGYKVRLYRDDGSLWFSGYLAEAPLLELAGEVMGAQLFRAALKAAGEMSALDRIALSEHVSMVGKTAGQAIAALSGEANSGFALTAVQDVAAAGSSTIEIGERWSAAAGQIADCARAELTVENHAVALAAIGTVTRQLSDGDAGFVPDALKLTTGAPKANDIMVIGSNEPAMYVRECFTSLGTETYYDLSYDVFDSTAAVLVEDDFKATALDPTKWVNDSQAALTFTGAGVETTSGAALRYRDQVEIGGLLMLEQTGISYTSGTGIFGGLFSGGAGDAVSDCLAGVMISNGSIMPVVGGAALAAAQQVSAGMLYEFRTLVFHPEPVRTGQAYASSVCNGQGARTSEASFGLTRIVLTMRQIDPTNAATASVAQTVIYDGTYANAQAYGDYCAMWGANLAATLGHAQATKQGAVWVQSMLPGAAWRTRVIGDVAAGAECYLSAKEVHFTAATEPVAGEQLEVFYRAKGLACGRVTDATSAQALANTEDAGTRAMVAHVTAPAPRTSLDCEQAARALLDDLTQAGNSGTYECWAGWLPQGATDVQPGELWKISLSWGPQCAAIVREVEIAFQGLADGAALFKVSFADDAAKPLAVRFVETKRNALIAVVASALAENVSQRPPGLPDARLSAWNASTMTLDMGTAPIAGGGFEVRVGGDWGWGTATSQNLVGRYSTQTFTLPNSGVTQAFYLRQYDGSTPPQYSPYTAVLKLVV
jgi:hypothetical protein